MGEVFYQAFKYAHRPGRTLDRLTQPFPDAHAYAERITDTLQVAQNSGDLAQGKTICTLCDLALASLPREHTAESVLCRRALKQVLRETMHYLARHANENGAKQKGEYDVRDTNALPTSSQAFKTFMAQTGKPEKK
ncbi:hypothetical protein HY492_02285 [Candidatus Woesearchaeota archaeon]|nr:hypothetical protein [Candidatus Woesearchaeota archaeon]